jgi:hypothetical protein
VLTCRSGVRFRLLLFPYLTVLRARYIRLEQETRESLTVIRASVAESGPR